MSAWTTLASVSEPAQVLGAGSGGLKVGVWVQACSGGAIGQGLYRGARRGRGRGRDSAAEHVRGGLRSVVAACCGHFVHGAGHRGRCLQIGQHRGVSGEGEAAEHGGLAPACGRHAGVRTVASEDVSHLTRDWYGVPTVVVADEPSAPIVREVVFGPVLAIRPADDEVHAIDLAEGARFGLIARVWTMRMRASRGSPDSSVSAA
ncbi:aldehyde dehydrogenase family protein [Streptomyces sp. NPDC057623]|uniref:aldehyde dehydrogenase family protein n=1 Tax=Streptomyces sp. NPDC057623 TaxID=3346187 RepID=UPI0036A5FC46